MFKNYLKIAWRDLLKNRRLSIINIAGLSFSVAFCLLLFFYIMYERSYDLFHKKKDHLYRMEMTNLWASAKDKPKEPFFSFITKTDEVKNQLVFPLIVGVDLKQTFPEVKSITRYQDQGTQLVRAKKEIYNEEHIIVADDNFFNNFSFPIIKGNKTTALGSPYNVVISKSTAKKYFGDAEPVGQTIELLSDSSRLFTVAAVAEDAPANSSIQYHIVMPLLADPDYTENITSGFNHSSHILMVELADPVSAAQFENKMNKWVEKYYVEPFVAENGQYYKDVDFSKFRWYLRPLADCHYNASGPWGHYTDANNIYQLACLVVVILLIASLNYVLLVISSAAARSQEVGVRKVMGARRRSIILQFWIQTQLVVMIAVLLGLLLSSLLLPLFNSMLNSSLSMDHLSWSLILPALLVLCVVLGIVAGYYPAFVISKIKIASIIKSFQTFKINPRFSRMLVVLQYTGCVVLMIAAFIVNRQMHYISNKNLGFDKEQVLMVTNPTWDGDFTKKTREHLYSFAGSQPYILQFSGMNGGLDGSYNSNGFKLNGEQKWRRTLTVDYGFFEMLGLKFVQGRPFSKNFASDTSGKMRPTVVNEALFNLLGKEARLGEYCQPLGAVIIGVVKDYHYETLSKKIEPEEHRLTTGYEMYFMFKIRAGQMQQAISKIEEEWKKMTDYPFQYTFLDQTIAKMYEADQRWQKIIQTSCFFAILIACMGLFGLSAINVANRTKEIGIRKILGANIKDLVTTLSSSFLLMIFISILIATPIAWWMMNKWLEDFAYRINISWWMFAAMGLAAILIALATISYHSIKAALVNPVKSLRAE